MEAVFHAENPMIGTPSTDLFHSALSNKLTYYAKKNSVDLKNRIDLSFFESVEDGPVINLDEAFDEIARKYEGNSDSLKQEGAG